MLGPMSAEADDSRTDFRRLVDALDEWTSAEEVSPGRIDVQRMLSQLEPHETYAL